MAAKLFEVAAFLEEKRDRTTQDILEEPEMIIKPMTMLARDDKQATLQLARQIPEELVSDMEKADRLVLVVRPF